MAEMGAVGIELGRPPNIGFGVAPPERDAGRRLGAAAPRVGLSKTGLVLFGEAPHPSPPLRAALRDTFRGSKRAFCDASRRSQGVKWLMWKYSSTNCHRMRQRIEERFV
jgi:hypothetical protein